MYARSTTISGDPGALDDAVALVRDEIWPALRDTDGCVGMSMACDRATGRCIATSAWRDREAMRASAARVEPMRRRLADRFGAQGDLAVQEWEVAVVHRAHAAGDGAWARITWVRGDPARTDALLDTYRSTLVPRIEEMPGFCSLSVFVDRDTGNAVGTVVFDDRASLEAARERARGLREEGVRLMGVDVLDVAEMELVVAHLRVPETV